MEGLLAIPRGWIESFGEIVKFTSRIVAEVFRLRVFKFFGEALRQAGILITGSALVICTLVFTVGLS
ncbi:MAG: ABC transporter permease, partial [Solirubrobacterales bacterium]|nr:ABC transporter permease [Solirubrobacterales bacterium]